MNYQFHPDAEHDAHPPRAGMRVTNTVVRFDARRHAVVDFHTQQIRPGHALDAVHRHEPAVAVSLFDRRHQ